LNKKISIILMVVLLTVTASTIIVSADGIKKIKFNAFASGSCLVIYGLGERGPDPFPYDVWYFGEGIGTTEINGTAKGLNPAFVWTEPPDILQWGDGYDSAKINALGYVSVSWTDENANEDNWIIAVIYSTKSTYGFFKLNNLLSIPIPGVTTPTPEFNENLKFKGIHVKGSEIEIIEGFALYWTSPLSLLSWGGDGHFYNVGLGIPIEGDNLIIYQLIWSTGDIGIPLADVIQCNVEEG
jgi:hypothetical protein